MMAVIGLCEKPRSNLQKPYLSKWLNLFGKNKKNGYNGPRSGSHEYIGKIVTVEWVIWYDGGGGVECWS